MIPLVFDLAARGKIRPLVHSTFPLERTKDAMDLMESRNFFGKIVLAISGDAGNR